MSSELQSLLEKIQRDGVEKANAEAAEITARAKEEAALIVKKAKEDAAAEKARSEAEQKAYAERASETIRQAARDTILEVENAVRKLLEKVLLDNVNEAMSSPEAAHTETIVISIKARRLWCGYRSRPRHPRQAQIPRPRRGSDP